MSEITDAKISETATKPKSIATDGMSVTMPSAMEQIEAANHVAANKTAASKRRGLLFTRLRPGSAVGR